MKIIVVVIFLIFIFKSLKNPLFGLTVVWYAIWLYPNSLLYGTLPVNFRLDDLLVFIIIISSLYHSKTKIIYILNNKLFVYSLSWWAIILLSSISGYLYSENEQSLEAFKHLFKALYVPFIVCSLILTIKNKYEVLKILKHIIIAGSIAGLLGIGTVLYPEIFHHFMIPDLEFIGTSQLIDSFFDRDTFLIRASGSIGIVGTSIVTLVCSLLTIYIYINNYLIFKRKLVLLLFFILSFIGLIYTQSRGPILSFAFSLFLITLLSAKKSKTFLFFSLLVVIFSFNSSLQNLVLARFFAEGTDSNFAQGLDFRYSIWNSFINNFDYALFLQGISITYVKDVYKMTVHNTYIGAFIYGGILGVLWLIKFVIFIIKNFLRDRMFNNEILNLQYFNLVLLFSFLILGFSIEVFQNTMAILLFLTLLSLNYLNIKFTRLENEKTTPTRLGDSKKG